jgi:DNA-directed RNA polymerase subunit RPC12/RpoP
MPDTVLVRCAVCGKEIGEVSYLPGKQVVTCRNCHKKTVVLIGSDGSVRVRSSFFN